MKGHHVLSSSWLRTLLLSFGFRFCDRFFPREEAVIVEAVASSDGQFIRVFHRALDFCGCVAERALHGLAKYEFMTSW